MIVQPCAGFVTHGDFSPVVLLTFPAPCKVVRRLLRPPVSPADSGNFVIFPCLISSLCWAICGLPISLPRPRMHRPNAKPSIRLSPCCGLSSSKCSTQPCHIRKSWAKSAPHSSPDAWPTRKRRPASKPRSLKPAPSPKKPPNSVSHSFPPPHATAGHSSGGIALIWLRSERIHKNPSIGRNPNPAVGAPGKGMRALKFQHT